MSKLLMEVKQVLDNVTLDQVVPVNSVQSLYKGGTVKYYKEKDVFFTLLLFKYSQIKVRVHEDKLSQVVFTATDSIIRFNFKSVLNAFLATKYILGELTKSNITIIMKMPGLYKRYIFEYILATYFGSWLSVNDHIFPLSKSIIRKFNQDRLRYYAKTFIDTELSVLDKIKKQLNTTRNIIEKAPFMFSVNGLTDDHYSYINMVYSHNNSDYDDTVDFEIVSDNKDDKDLLIEKIVEHKNKEIEELRENLVEAVSFNELLKERIKNSKFNFHQTNIINKPNSNSIALMLLSDIHLGTVADITIDGVKTFNRYNTDIAYQRLDYLFNEVLKNIEINNYSELKIAILGDLFNGIIHEEFKYSNPKIIDNILELADYLFTKIVELNKIVKVSGFGVAGNHGRIQQKVEFTNKAINNFDYLVYKILKTYLSTVDIEFHAPAETTYVTELLGKTYMFHHGDIVRGSGNNISGSPSITASKVAMKLVNKYKHFYRDIEALIIGHFHTFFYIPGLSASVIGNPSVMGVDSFANENALFSKPEQLLLKLTPDGVSDIKRIDLSHII